MPDYPNMDINIKSTFKELSNSLTFSNGPNGIASFILKYICATTYSPIKFVKSIFELRSIPTLLEEQLRVFSIINSKFLAS